MCSSWRFLHAGRFWHMPFKSSLQLKEQHSEGGKLKHFNFPKAHPVTDCCHSCDISPFPAVSETIIVRKFKWKPQAHVLSSHSFVFWGNNHCKSGHSCTSSSFMSNTWALSSYSCVLSVSAVRIPFWHLEEAILIFWFADAVSVDLNLATLFSPLVLHNGSPSLSQRSCQIIVGELSARNQGLHIIAAIIMHPQTPNYSSLTISINGNFNTPALTTGTYYRLYKLHKVKIMTCNLKRPQVWFNLNWFQELIDAWTKLYLHRAVT